MKLSNSHGSNLELTIADYQFPQLSHAKYDSNWLKIHIQATLVGQSWAVTSPCLLTWEVEYLARWLEKISTGQPTRPEIFFTEPVLTFRLVESETDGKCLRVFFDHESRPPWAARRLTEADEIWIDFPLAEIDFAQIAEDLSSQLQLYPKRATQLLGKIRLPQI